MYEYCYSNLGAIYAQGLLAFKQPGPGTRFSKLPVITGPVKLVCFPFQMGVSKILNIIQ